MEKLDAKTRAIGTLLSQEFFFRIPGYQRPFSLGVGAHLKTWKFEQRPVGRPEGGVQSVAEDRLSAEGYLFGTAKVSRVNRKAVKSGCAGEWDAWGRLSDDGRGQHNPAGARAPGVERLTARTEELISPSALTQSREWRWKPRARRTMATRW
jgi:hypothetical protein